MILFFSFQSRPTTKIHKKTHTHTFRKREGKKMKWKYSAVCRRNFSGLITRTRLTSKILFSCIGEKERQILSNSRIHKRDCTREFALCAWFFGYVIYGHGLKRYVWVNEFVFLSLSVLCFSFVHSRFFVQRKYVYFVGPKWYLGLRWTTNGFLFLAICF